MSELRNTVFCGEVRSSFCLKVPTLNPLVFLIKVVSIYSIYYGNKHATSSLENLLCFIFKILLVFMRAAGRA
jgi:hypothetical protein